MYSIVFTLNSYAIKYFVAVVLLMTVLQVKAQTPDTLVYFRDLAFNSEFEKETFKRLEKKDIDLFSLFMASGSLLGDKKIKESQEKFYNHVALLNRETATRKNDKRTKAIYDDIHKTFLNKYELKNRFEEIFYNGYYNCVSATAIYALAFEKTMVPYTIKEEPGHVYLIAYPQAERIVLQTTSPTGGFYTLSDEFKQRFVKSLKDQKIISAQEFSSQGVAQLFDKHYFGTNEDLTAVQLAGVQYMNEGLYKCDDKMFEEAFQQFEKAYLLFPGERAAHLLIYSGTQAFAEHKTNDSTKAVLLSKLARYKKYGLSEDLIKSEFARATQTLLFETAKKSELDAYYTILLASIENEKLKSDISYIYYYENGRVLYNQAKYKDALPYTEKALAQKNTNLDAQGMFLSTLGQTLSSLNNLDVIKRLEEYNTRFSFLKENNHFNLMLTTSYLLQFHRSYSTNKITEGDKYKVLFEAMADKYPSMPVNAELIGQSYSTAAVYYYRKGQTTKAKQLIQSGLRYAPNNYELTMREDMIK